MSQAYLAFKEITPEDIKNFSLQEALTKVGLSQGMSEQQLLDCKWHVCLLRQRIKSLQIQKQNEFARLQRQKQNEFDRLQRQYEFDRLQRQNEFARLQRQNEALQAQQRIAKLQEENQKLKKRISDQEALRNQSEQAIAGREQAVAGREQAVLRREQAVLRREQAVVQREQAIRLQQTPYYFKWQFLWSYLFCLIAIGITLALGWKRQDEPGYYGLLGGLIIALAFTVGWIVLLIWKGCIEWEARKARETQIEQKKRIQLRQAQPSAMAFQHQGGKR